LSSKRPSETSRHSSVSNINNDAFNLGFSQFSKVFFRDMFLEDSEQIPSQRNWIPCNRPNDVIFCPDDEICGIKTCVGYCICPDGISTGLRLASFSLPYTHLYIFSDSSCHVVCFSPGFFLRFWHSLHISSLFMVFVVSSFVPLSFCAF
jgi:hypothetical protein